MKHLKVCFATLVVSLLTLALVAPHTSQARSSDEMKRIVREAEETSNDLDDDLPDAINKTALKGTAEAKRIKWQIEELEDTLDQIRKRFNGSVGFDELRNLVDRALDLARDIDPIVQRYHLTADVQSDWQKVREHLNSMARYFGVRPLSSH